MRRVRGFFGGRVRFTVWGLPISCINRLRVFHPTCVTYDSGTVCFSVPLSAAAAVKKLVSNFEWKATENFNFFRGVNFLLSRMALTVAVLLCGIAFFVSDMNVYDIRVAGANAELTAEVYEYLDELGVKKFITKRKISALNIADKVVNTFPNISHANARVSGNTLVISVIESESNPVGRASNVYARYDAVIKSVTAASGTLHAGVGDVVRKGDLLAENVYPNTIAIIGEVAFEFNEKIIRLDISII